MTSVAFYGSTGVGKTYTVYHGLKILKQRPLLIRSLEELDVLAKPKTCPYTDIIFDDISFELTRPELLIHLCDKDFDGGVRILHRYVKINKSIRKWFTHNNIEAWRPLLCSREQQQAINRRLTVHKVSNRNEIWKYVKKEIRPVPRSCSEEDEG